MGFIGIVMAVIGAVAVCMGETDNGRFLIIIGSIWVAAYYARQGKK